MAKRGKRRGTLASLQARRQKYASARKELSKLKSIGLVSKRANLRKAKPSSALLKKLDVLRPVLYGRAAPIELPRNVRASFKDAGYKTIGKYTVVPKNEYERVRVSKEGMPELIARKPKPGERYMRRIVLPADVSNGPSFRAWLEGDFTRLEKLAPDGAIFAFTFKGHMSREAHTADEMVEYLSRYRMVFGDGGEDQFEQLILYAVDYETAKGIEDEARAKAETKRAFRLRVRASKQAEAKRKRESRSRKASRIKV